MAQEDIEQKIKLTYETNADETSQTVNNLTENVERTTEAQTRSAKATKSQGDAIRDLAPAATSAVDSLKTMGKAMWALVANPLGVVLTAIAVVLGVLFLAFKSFQPVVDKVEQAFAALGAVVNVIRNAFLAVVNGTESLGKAFGSLSDDMDDAAKRTMKLVKAQQDLEDVMKSQEVTTARNRAEISKLNVQLRDRTKTEEQRLKIADKIVVKENEDYQQRKKIVDAEVRQAREAIAIKAKFSKEEMKRLKETGDATKELAESRGGSYDDEYDALNKARIKAIALEDEVTVNLEKTFNRRDKLEDDKIAKQEKAEGDATARREKAQAEAEKRQEKSDADREKRKEEAAKVAEAKRKKEIDDAYNLKLEQDQVVLDIEAASDKRVEDQAEKDAQEGANKAARMQADYDEQVRLDQALVDQKAKNKDDILATGEALISGAKMLAGKNKALQKAAIIVEGAVSLGKVGVNIATGVSKDAATGAIASTPQIIKTLATGAVSTAAIISNTARALKAVGGGSLSDGGRTVSQGASASPQVNFQGSKENQIGNTVAGKLNAQAPIKVVVLESDITKTQTSVQAKVVSNSF